MKQSKEVKQNCSGQENFDICYSQCRDFPNPYFPSFNPLVPGVQQKVTHT